MMKNSEGLPLKDNFASASAYAFAFSSASSAAVFYFFFDFGWNASKPNGVSSSSSIMARGSFGLNSLIAPPPNGLEEAAAANGFVEAAEAVPGAATGAALAGGGNAG